MHLKKAEVLPIYKKDRGTEKSNYRPVSVSSISKIYEMKTRRLKLINPICLSLSID